MFSTILTRLAWNLLIRKSSRRIILVIHGEQTLKLSAEQKGFMVAVPILSGAILRILLGLLVDRIGAKNAGIMAQIIVIAGLAMAWVFGLPGYAAVLLMGIVLG